LGGKRISVRCTDIERDITEHVQATIEWKHRSGAKGWIGKVEGERGRAGGTHLLE
tara:strand:- start:260 stop:424 length:165 start_codon:yes stop_codon:yes gene_type:complete